VGDPTQLREIFEVLGSNANPFLTQLARSKRLVFVEGKDFQIISRFAGKLGIGTVATRSAFAVVPTQGFNPTKVRIFREGVEATTGTKVEVAVVFDRDYRSDQEVAKERAEMGLFCNYAHIHSRKELENFLLVPSALKRAIVQRIAEQNRRTGGTSQFTENMDALLLSITDVLKHDVQAQFLKRQHPFAKSLEKALDDTTITSALLAAFEEKWKDLTDRLRLVPGKEVLSRLNTHLQEKWNVTITPITIIESMSEQEVPQEMKEIVTSLEEFAKGC
jgi:hypothetical protein